MKAYLKMSDDMNKFVNFSTFSMVIWIFSTLPLALTNFFETSPEDHIYGWVGGTLIAAFVVFILASWSLLRVRFKRLPPGGTVVAAIYALLFITLFTWVLVGWKQEPLIWEFIGPMLVLLCPVTMIVASPVGMFSILSLPIAFGLGIGYYLLIGNVIFEKLDKKHSLAILSTFLLIGLTGYGIWLIKNFPLSNVETVGVITSLGSYGCFLIILFLTYTYLGIACFRNKFNHKIHL